MIRDICMIAFVVALLTFYLCVLMYLFRGDKR